LLLFSLFFPYSSITTNPLLAERNVFMHNTHRHTHTHTPTHKPPRTRHTHTSGRERCVYAYHTQTHTHTHTHTHTDTHTHKLTHTHKHTHTNLFSYCVINRLYTPTQIPNSTRAGVNICVWEHKNSRFR